MQILPMPGPGLINRVLRNGTSSVPEKISGISIPESIQFHFFHFYVNFLA